MSPNRRATDVNEDRAGGDAPDDSDTSLDGTAQDDTTVEPRTTATEQRDTTVNEEAFGPVDDGGPRDIVVPTRLFKLITVVTTLIAVPTVVLGFMFLDAATLQTSVARGTILFVVTWLGIPVEESIVSVLLGLVGITLIAAGAGIYIVGSRFRAAEMGNAEEDTDEETTNG